MWGDNYTFPDEDLPDSVTLPCGCVVEVQWLHTMASGLVGCVASRATICGERHKSSIEKMARDVAREMYESRMEWQDEAKGGY